MIATLGLSSCATTERGSDGKSTAELSISGRWFQGHHGSEYYFTDGKWVGFIYGVGEWRIDGNWDVNIIENRDVRICIDIIGDAKTEALVGESICRVAKISRQKSEIDIPFLLDQSLMLDGKLLTPDMSYEGAELLSIKPGQKIGLNLVVD